ncbi:MAG TPA: hypothetical protein VK196_01460 [Magnetospirillum sp.]|nr:hypothetical protein [Magnetospirillum sp.]
MPLRRLALAAVAAGTLFPAVAWAQAAGGVPPYEPPAPVGPPVRDGEVMGRPQRAGGAFAEQPATVADFAQTYARNGRPRLALYWNRQLSEALSDWYSDVRVTSGSQSNSSMSGEFTLNQSSTSQNTLEVQRRIADPRRGMVGESFEWEFQDAFLAPFLEAGAVVVDRGAMMRLAAADEPTSSEKTVEVRGLQGKADYLLEILVAPNWRSSTGYELRARILDIKTGAIVAMVNSKNLREWNPEKPVLATNHGFVDPNDADDADESFGPQGEDKYRATATGYERRRKPPKLSNIARNLAYNTMSGLMRTWK